MRNFAPLLLSLALACSTEAGGTSGASATETSTSSPSTGSDATTDSSSGTGTTTGTTGTSATGTTADDPTTGTAQTSDPSTTGTTTDATGGTTVDTTTGPGTTTSTTGDPPSPFTPASLVVLGDSIGDGGGQPPFYYNLLRADLEAEFGPGFQYVNNAQSGSETDALLNQAKSLPKQLPGPVAVVITSGGNDMKAALPQILGGLDGPLKQQVAANIDAALAELLAPGRFGPGVEVRVFEGNVYDASDGEGNYSEGNCAFGQGLPPIPTDMYFDSWNGAIRDAVLAREQTPVEMHMHFYGHGYNNPPNWYAGDCTHPSTLGHDQLRRLFYYQITGEMLP